MTILASEQDFVFATRQPAALLDAFVRLLRTHYPALCLENAVTGERYASFAAIPFGKLPHILAHSEDDLFYLAPDKDAVTVVVRWPLTSTVAAVLESMRALRLPGETATAMMPLD